MNRSPTGSSPDLHNSLLCSSAAGWGVVDSLAYAMNLGQNGGMYMSVELIAVIITAASLLVTAGGGMFAGFAWVLRRMDERFHTVDQKFERIDLRFDRMDEKFDQMDERIHGIQTELTEVKVSVARLEGPTPRLILPR